MLLNIRKIFPDSEIILSTWENSDVSFLSFDKVILSKDPGATIYLLDDNNRYNVNRQIVSTFNGLKLASKKYAIKTRTDVIFTHCNFIKYFSRFPRKSKNLDLLEHKVIVSNYTTVNPTRILPFTFHVCDWFYFGLTSDLMNIWDIELCSEDEARWFEKYPKPLNHPFEIHFSRYQAEQFIWYSFIKKNIDINFKDCCDMSDSNVALSENIIANNVIILSPNQLGIKSLKYPDIHLFYAHFYQMYSHLEWVRLYHKYCGGLTFSVLDVDLFLYRLYFFDTFIPKLHAKASMGFGAFLKFVLQKVESHLKQILKTLYY